MDEAHDLNNIEYLLAVATGLLREEIDGEKAGNSIHAASVLIARAHDLVSREREIEL